jgi:hypothetical protein
LVRFSLELFLFITLYEDDIFLGIVSFDNCCIRRHFLGTVSFNDSLWRRHFLWNCFAWWLSMKTTFSLELFRLMTLYEDDIFLRIVSFDDSLLKDIFLGIVSFDNSFMKGHFPWNCFVWWLSMKTTFSLELFRLMTLYVDDIFLGIVSLDDSLWRRHFSWNCFIWWLSVKMPFPWNCFVRELSMKTTISMELFRSRTLYEDDSFLGIVSFDNPLWRRHFLSWILRGWSQLWEQVWNTELILGHE